MALIDFDNEKHRLGMDEMDATHIDFIKQVNALDGMRGEELEAGFSNLLQHTVRHFEREDELMEQCAFPQINEHRQEHRKVVAEMSRFAGKMRRGDSPHAHAHSFIRAYIRERLPEWFNLHLATMDSALAWHLNQHTQGETHVI